MSGPRIWARDLAMGIRFAFGGGREGWTRTLLTGVGVGLGVALLLVGTAVPGALAAREERSDARAYRPATAATAPGSALLSAGANQTYGSRGIEGRLVRAEGPSAPVPPGLDRVPAPGEMAVSPALKRLLGSADGALLRERLDAWEPTQVISDAGLSGPGDLFFYAGQGDLAVGGPDDDHVQRVGSFQGGRDHRPLDPVLMLLVVLTFVALLTPVAVFIAAAVRFGGERRDRRLAALRLVGADVRAVRRIAAGEALAGAVLGLAVGSGFFVIARRLVGGFDLQGRSVFPADLDPSAGAALLVALAVSAAAVAVTLFALRPVVIEPLGVVRATKPGRRRVGWRLLLPLAGLALLVPLLGRGRDHGYFNQWQVGGGVVLLLIAVTALLPWVLERLVGRLSGGPVSWQLAVRRLQVSSGSAARLVNGVAVAVAGAIALQMLFAGVEGDYTQKTRQDLGRAAVSVLLPRGEEERAEALGREIAAKKGIAKAVPLTGFRAAHRVPAEPDQEIPVTVGTCEALAEVAVLGPCKDGDAFVLSSAPGGARWDAGPAVAPGDLLHTGDIVNDGRAPGLRGTPVPWTLPADARTVPAREDPTGDLRAGLLMTPAAKPKGMGPFQSAQIFVQPDDSDPHGLERIRTAAFKADHFATAMTLKSTGHDIGYSAVRIGLLFGATGVLILIGASMLVSQLEQLRERRTLLASLVAFGTKRSTLALSVLWQTALPVGVGLALAAGIGTGLGTALMKMAGRPARVDWASVAQMTGIGAGTVLAVTLLSLPPLLRLMRPDGLRTE